MLRRDRLPARRGATHAARLAGRRRAALVRHVHDLRIRPATRGAARLDANRGRRHAAQARDPAGPGTAAAARRTRSSARASSLSARRSPKVGRTCSRIKSSYRSRVVSARSATSSHCRSACWIVMPSAGAGPRRPGSAAWSALPGRRHTSCASRAGSAASESAGPRPAYTTARKLPDGSDSMWPRERRRRWGTIPRHRPSSHRPHDRSLSVRCEAQTAAQTRCPQRDSNPCYRLERAASWATRR
jgi:hypothetical protein